MLHRVSRKYKSAALPLPPSFLHVHIMTRTCSINYVFLHQPFRYPVSDLAAIGLVMIFYLLNKYLTHLQSESFLHEEQFPFSLKVCSPCADALPEEYCCRYRYHQSYYHHHLSCQNRRTRTSPLQTCPMLRLFSSAIFVVLEIFGEAGIFLPPQAEA